SSPRSTPDPPPARSGACRSRVSDCAAPAARTPAASGSGSARSDRTGGSRRGRTRRAGEPDQAIAVEVAIGGQPLVLAGDAGHLRGIAHGDPPRPREHRGLDARGHRVIARQDVVGDAAKARRRASPEDRVTDEAVVALRSQQGLELGAGLELVEPPPDHRREARVPEPLPRIVPGAGPGVGERDAIRGPHTLDPILFERPLAHRAEPFDRLDLEHPPYALGTRRSRKSTSTAALRSGSSSHTK